MSKQIDLEQIEFVINTLKEVADKITLVEMEFYVLPSVVLDNAVENIRKAAASLSKPKPQKEKK